MAPSSFACLLWLVYVHNIQATIDLTLIDGFEWDEGNARRNDKHGVAASETEQVFFMQSLLMLEDARHS